MSTETENHVDEFPDLRAAKVQLKKEKHELENEKLEMEVKFRRIRTQRKIATASFITLITVIFWVVFYAPIERVVALDAVLDMMFISLTGVIAAYFGVEGWVSRGTQDSDRYDKIKRERY